jgi:hypothetical protein
MSRAQRISAMGKLELLHRNADQCRSLADTAITMEARAVLLDMAQEYDDRATSLQTTGLGPLDSFGWVGDEVLPKERSEIALTAGQQPMAAMGRI